MRLAFIDGTPATPPFLVALRTFPVPPRSEQDHWFAQEVQPHGPLLRSWLLARFPSLGDVDNLVQEAFVRLWRSHEKSRVEAPRALLFATARNLAIDWVRREKVVSFEPIPENDESFVLTDNTDVAETVSQQQELALLSEAIQGLPERCRQVFTLRTFYRMSQKEVAAELGIGESTVEKQMAKAVLRCTEFFAARGLP